MSEHKTLTGVEIKDADQGLVSAVFATLNVKDHDGDVTTPGAFEDGADVRISSFGHTSWGGALPVGKGTIREDGDKAILEGKFFLNTTAGRDHFETVKQMGSLMEWSYGYDIVDGGPGTHDGEKVNFLRKLKVHEVSPVLIGAGIDTHTVAVKDRGTFPDHLGAVLGDVRELIDRVEGWGSESGQKEGRVLSAANRDRLMTMHASLEEMRDAIARMLADTDPNKHRDEARRAIARYLTLEAQLLRS